MGAGASLAHSHGIGGGSGSNHSTTSSGGGSGGEAGRHGPPLMVPDFSLGFVGGVLEEEEEGREWGVGMDNRDSGVGIGVCSGRERERRYVTERWLRDRSENGIGGSGGAEFDGESNLVRDRRTLGYGGRRRGLSVLSS